MKIKALHIGGLTIDMPVMLAPMAGYTDMAMRTLCQQYGSGLVMTEVISTQAINYNSRRTFLMLETGANEHPIGAHIYGHDPEAMAIAARTIEKLGRFDFIDINCGCPVRKLVAKGHGAALMKNPELIGEIVSAVSASVSLPVTVKTRIGLSPERKNISEVAQAVEEAGGKAIFIHARFASDRHSGDADWNTLAEVKAERNIPVIGNGGIDKATDAVAMFKVAKVDGVMIGRAALGNPWIFNEVCCLLDKKTYNRCSHTEWRAVIIQHLMVFIALKEKEFNYHKNSLSAEEAAVICFRGHLSQYLCGLAGSLYIRRNMQKLKSLQDVGAAVDYVIKRQKRKSSNE
ncbi:MAG: tRNA-dihydrouridine synthase family protein, partial [Clostridiales bacterium]|nr:tRNA-dihydrouridine synthase family protein [Clostridiales bacterium]